MTKRKKIFIDLDGVLVDWASAMMRLAGLDPACPIVREKFLQADGKIDNFVGGAVKVYELIDAAGIHFWTSLRLFPWARPLVTALEHAAGHRAHIAFLTSPGRFPHAYEGKRAWLAENFPAYRMILCKDKYLVASNDAILIDDADYQVKPFIHHGGQAYLWPNQFLLEDHQASLPDRQLIQAKAITDCVRTVQFKLAF